jgi:putative membrane-bound dehydrogenase-like protein
MSRCLSAAVLASLILAVPAAQKEYGFDNRKPSGQPYLKPEESVARMKAADGFEVKLFAAEPLVVNPIAMTVDEKGRVWVIECFEYPKRTAKGQAPRDRIVILEDTKGTGVADKRTVFAEGKDFPVPFDLASGLEVGDGGVYVGAPPYLFFIENKNDRPGKFTILLKGFGSQDTHETLNTFQWGPDGRLYGLHGVFTQSEVKPAQADGPGERLNAGVWRYDTHTKKFETFAEGTSNPWGMDWRNSDGQFILCCCVIPHLFHISPGGTYKRQAGQSFNPYAYGEIKEICDHTFHKESGWAHAGLISLDTPIVPEQYRDSVIFGSIHGCSIKRNVLKKNGSTYTASRADDFVQSGDKNFRPINLRWGPNGEIYCIDWHDQNPCHQADANSWDYEHGRVFRIQPKGLKTKKAEDLGKKTEAELVRLLDDPNPYVYRTALRLLGEPREKHEAAIVPLLARGVLAGNVRSLWAIHAGERAKARREKAPYDEPLNTLLAGAPWGPAYRVWLVRFLGEADQVTPEGLSGLETLAAREAAPEVRLQLASTALRLAGKHDTGPILHNLLQYPEDAKDPAIPQVLWLAYEKHLSKERGDLDWLRDHAVGNALITDTIVPRALRRLAAGGKADDLKACVAFLAGLERAPVKRRALEGLTTALKGRTVDAPDNWKETYAALLKDGDAEVKKLAQALAINFRDPVAARAALAAARDPKRPPQARAAAVRDLAVARLDEAKRPLLEMLLSENDVELRQEVCRALSGLDGDDIPAAVLKGWKGYPPPVRVEAVNLLAGRKDWAGKLLDAVGDRTVPRTDLTDNTILRLRAFKDSKLDDRIKAVWGNIRDTPPDLNKLIEQMRGEVGRGTASFERGRKVFDNQCAKCHKFEGRGHDVGPALDGAARDIEYLLVNVLDPNRVIGAPYFQRFVVLKKGQVETGLLAAEDADTITLKNENAALKVIAKKDVERVEVKELSLMPEGLTKNMSVQDFRDLIRYVMASPFVTEGQASQALPTNVATAISPESPTGVRGANWSPLSAPVTGRLPLPATKEKAAAFVQAQVTAPKALKTRLLLGANADVKAYLNGRLVYEGRPGNAANPDQAGVEVELTAGANQLLIRADYQGDREAVYARFLDPDRLLRYPEPKD